MIGDLIGAVIVAVLLLGFVAFVVVASSRGPQFRGKDKDRDNFHD